MDRISLTDVNLTFRPRQRGTVTIKDYFLAKLFRRPVPAPPVVYALKGVTFRVREGERLGILGHNGAGKSSLLRVLAGVYKPTSGTCAISGRVSSMFELTLGFESEATGWENIRYRGYMQKETPRTIGPKMDAIAEFSELGSALDMPIRYYSSGMLIRLAFSIATAVDPEVLLIDEVLAAGDLAFIEKARRRMRALMDRARAIVLVSHDMANLATMSDRVLWMNKGEVRMIGEPAEVIGEYEAYMRGVAAAKAA